MADDVRDAIVETLMQRAAMEGGGMGAGAPAAMAPEQTQPPPVSAPADPAFPTQPMMRRQWNRRGGFDPGQVAREFATANPGIDPATDPAALMSQQRTAMRGALGQQKWGGMFGADSTNSGTPSYSMAGPQGTGGMFGAGGGMAPPPQSGGMMGKGMASAPPSGQPTGPSGFGGKATPGAAPSMMGA